MKPKRRVLFLQLPGLDNEVSGPRENVPLAAVYLNQALAASGEGRFHEGVFLPPAADDADNAELARMLDAARPDVVACTLYLWNIERSLRVLGEARARLPGLAVAVGGPEVFTTHPFLYRTGVADAVAVGEGENVFPDILRALRCGGTPNVSTVAWKRGRRYTWGRRTPAPVRLRDYLPFPPAEAVNPNPHAIGYLETTRGCPMRCAFCRYHQLRAGVDALPPDTVARRARALAARGAREIKFTDPTFNSHPRFESVLKKLVAANRAKRVAFYAELKADAITEAQADLLAAAHFTEIEVGLQSRDPGVLKTIRRPTDMPALERGIRRLTSRGINVTLDVMYGLPGQTEEDVYASVRWGKRFRRVRVQCMQTLLLPGTELRQRAAEWKMRAPKIPPYGVLSTATLSRTQVRHIEDFIAATPGLPADARTRRFVGVALPDLFPERHVLPVSEAPLPKRLPGTQNRRTLIFRGAGLYEHRRALRAALRRAVRQEPDILWQFVLAPATEEPLDLFEELSLALKAAPPHWLDRPAGSFLTGRLASRRILVLLRRNRVYDATWVEAAERWLEERFY